MAGSPGSHRDAAIRHEEAAAKHDDAARFWGERGRRARADLHRDAAMHEREGASLERRWENAIAIDVDVRALDSYEFLNVNLLKIDVEGHGASAGRGRAGA